MRVPLFTVSPYIDLRCMDGGTGVGLEVVKCGLGCLSPSTNSARLTPSYPANMDCHGKMKDRGYGPGKLGVVGECVDRDYVIS